MAYDTTEAVAKFLSGFQMEITHRGKGTFTPDHVKYSLTIANGGKDFSTTFESNPQVHGEPTITQVFGALASDAMVVRDYGMDEFAVNEKGYDAVFAEQWKAELSECDIDPEAVSVDSEAHDMENGRDGLDGNAPEKDAPEKDDRDAQPPVDTDNR